MYMVGSLLNLAINVYVTIIIVQVAVSWLVSFNIINPANSAAQRLIILLRKATDPVYEPLRRFIPPIGGIDLTPLVVIITLSFISEFVVIPLFFHG